MVRRRWRDQAELPPEDNDLVEFGGELYFAVDFTEGGAPIGIPVHGRRGDERERSRVVGWAVAKGILEEVARSEGARAPRDAVGRVRFLDRELSNDVYGATLVLDGREIGLVVKLPSREAATDRDERVRREAELLRYLTHIDLPFGVPRAVAELPASGGVAAVQEWAEGVPVDLRADRFPGGRPWELVGRVAAAIHSLDPTPFRELLPGHTTGREHAIAFSRVLDALAGAEGDEARAWVQAHLPPPEPARLLHGDLLGQNLYLSFLEERPTVIDWGEAGLGDPAYELAIVTRGARRPFGRPDGLERLLEVYNTSAPAILDATSVHLHEVLLRAKLYLDVVDAWGEKSPHASNELQKFRSLLSRCGCR